MIRPYALVLGLPALASNLALGLALASTPSSAFAADDPPAAATPADQAEELAKAKARIAELEAEVAALKAQLAGGVPAASPTSPPSPTGEARFASPAAIFRTLSDDYTTSLAELLPTPGDPAETAIFRRELERWVASVNRTYRHAVRWNCRLARTEAKGEGMVATIEPIDAATGASLGEPCSVALEPRIARRVASAARGRAGDDPWILTGTFVPEVRFQPDRMQRGDFDNPPLLGPGAAFLWRLEVDSLVPGRREKPAEPAKPAAPNP